MIRLTLSTHRYRMAQPFAISRGTRTHARALRVTLADRTGNVGRGEAIGVHYSGETPETMAAEIEAIRRDVEAGINPALLQSVLRAGGTRNAVDAALWDLEAKASGIPAWKSAGLSAPQPVVTAYTIVIQSPENAQAAATAAADMPLLKVKVDGNRHLEIVEAVRRGSPDARLIVDPNASWTFEQLQALAPRLAEIGKVELIEQPLPVGADEALQGWTSPIPLCADESLETRTDLGGLAGRYQVVNVKLDKTGGLTEALALSRAARERGFGLMVGCMVGSSLAMAPAAIVAQGADFVDLDGPLLLAEDCDHPIRYEAGRMHMPERALWG